MCAGAAFIAYNINSICFADINHFLIRCSSTLHLFPAYSDNPNESQIYCFQLWLLLPAG